MLYLLIDIMKSENKKKEPSEYQLREAEKIKEKTEKCLDEFFYVLCDEHSHDVAAVGLSVLVYAIEEIFQHEELDSAYFLINKIAMAIYDNEKNIKKKSSLLIGENFILSKEKEVH